MLKKDRQIKAALALSQSSISSIFIILMKPTLTLLNNSTFHDVFTLSYKNLHYNSLLRIMAHILINNVDVYN